jgi:hypothetical protein
VRPDPRVPAERPSDGDDGDGDARHREPATAGGVLHIGVPLFGPCSAIIGDMNTDSIPARLGPAKPTLDGIEDKWSRAWEMGRVVQV